MSVYHVICIFIFIRVIEGCLLILIVLVEV